MARSKGTPSGGSGVAEHEINGFICEGTSLTGELTLEGGYRVDGRLTGKLSSRSTIIVGPRGEVDAESLRVASLLVAGVVRGTLHVEERLEIHPGGRVYGRVTMSKPGFVLSRGGVFEGTLVMARPSEEAAGRDDPDASEVATGA